MRVGSLRITAWWGADARRAGLKIAAMVMICTAAAVSPATATDAKTAKPGMKTVYLAPIARAPDAPPGSTPPNLDPRNLEGVWMIYNFRDLYGPAPDVPPPFKPKYMALLNQRIKDDAEGHPQPRPLTRCLPHGMPRVMATLYPHEVVQTPGQINIFQEVSHQIRRIYLDQPHSKNPLLTYEGDSVGHWEGDTLVVDTIALSDISWIDDAGSPHSNQMHLVERITKINGGKNLEIVITVNDPVALERPYNFTLYWSWRPDLQPAEYNCEENNRDLDKLGFSALAGVDKK
jgi:hypothetical protein